MQEPAPFCSLQTAFDPQGDGMHGVGLSWENISAEREQFIVSVKTRKLEENIKLCEFSKVLPTEAQRKALVVRSRWEIFNE